MSTFQGENEFTDNTTLYNWYLARTRRRSFGTGRLWLEVAPAPRMLLLQSPVQHRHLLQTPRCLVLQIRNIFKRLSAVRSFRFDEGLSSLVCD